MTRNDVIVEEPSDHFAQNRNYFLTFTLGIISLLAFAMTGPNMPNPSQYFAAVGGSTLSAPVLSATGVSCVSSLPRVGFSWTPYAGASTYTLQRKLALSDAWVGVLQGGITDTTYIDALWQRDHGAQTYYYRIAAVNAVSRSYSNEVAVYVGKCGATPVSALTPAPVPAPTPIPTPAPTPTPSPVAGKMPQHMKWGAYVGWSESAMRDFEQLTGRKTDMEMTFSHWGNDAGFPMSYGPRVRDQGKTLVVFWEAVDYNRNYFQQPEYSFDAVLAGKQDAYLRNFAAGAKAYGGPVILLPYSEFNGNWFPWSGTVNGNTPEKYIAAWRYIDKFFVDVPNVKMAWAPNSNSVPNAANNRAELFYPGDAYVDYVGVDGFNFGGAWPANFHQVFSAQLQNLKQFRKPIYIFSMSTVDGPGKAAWITNALTVELYKYPEVVGWLWFNENKERDWRINSDPASLQAFKSAL